MSDGTNVYVFFPDVGLLAYGPAGEELWTVTLGPFQSIYGISTSPVVANDKVILNLDQLSGSFLAAYFTRNGELAWRRNRPESSGAISTPIVLRQPSRPVQVLVPGSLGLARYDVRSGEELWSVGGLAAASFSGPVADQDSVYLAMASTERNLSFAIFDKNSDGYLVSAEAPTGLEEAVGTWGRSIGDRDGRVDQDEFLEIRRYLQNGRTSVLEVSLDGSGAQSEKAIRWQYFKGFPLIPSPLFYDGLIYLLKGGGILSSLDPATGQEVKVGRLRDAVDAYYASPVAGDGKIYAASEGGKLSVIKAGADWSVLSTTDLEEPIHATPAIYKGRLFIRTAEALYAFGPGD